MEAVNLKVKPKESFSGELTKGYKFDLKKSNQYNCEINNRINELETSIELLKAIRQDFVENKKEEIFIKALNDGINYTTQRLDKYKTTDWIMTID